MTPIPTRAAGATDAAPGRPVPTTTPVQWLRRRDTRGLRVTLVRPPVVIQVQGLSGKGPVPPIGLAYIAGAARAAGHDVTVVDGAGAAIDQEFDYETSAGTLRRIGLSPAEIADRVDVDAQVVGITHLFLHEWPDVREIATLVRRRCPGATIVVGGENATAFWPWILRQSPAVDVCVLGEGESVFVELLDRLRDGESLDDLPGVARRSDLDTSTAAVPGAHLDDTAPTTAPRIRDLGSIPVPAWDLFPIDAYLATADTMGVNRGRSMPMMATRGCPYRCTFCSSPQMWTTRYRVREPADVVDEIADHVERYGVRNVNFCDLTAITKRGWTLSFCDELDRRGLDISWQIPAGTRAEALDAEVLGRLYDTGCRNLTYAPESGSARMLEIFDKRVDLERLLESLRDAHRLGISTHVNIIIGHPEEHWSDLWATARFLVRAANAGCNTASPIMFGPYPGSVDFARLVSSGELVIDEDYYYVGLSRGSASHRSFNPRLSGRTLWLVQLAMVLGFHGFAVLRRPRRLLDMITAQVTGRERDHFDQLVRVKRQQRSSERRSPMPVRRAS